jgi:hypothetical protein
VMATVTAYPFRMQYEELHQQLPTNTQVSMPAQLLWQ